MQYSRSRQPPPSLGAPTPEPLLIAGRYELQQELGGGGMAIVYLVRDRQSGRKLALKRPQSRGTLDRHHLHELFAREYHTLSQLAHPRIVEVYDYGVEHDGPFYTMELLDGGDLQQLVPADYRRVCAVARDICSALSLLHSRRIVHRDVSPRNVRCTPNGTAKLIDFGAMSLIGPSKELVGTPVYCAPEVLNMLPLDARTDLYALGATLYYVLTGHHAYPVRDFAGLPNAWRFGIARPSEIARDIPEALDALVLDLLQLDPENRPSSATEVMERLAAIEGRPIDEQLLVAQAYLTTPAFIARETELSRVKTQTLRAMHKRGSAIFVQGAAGAGRSRFLDASMLAAKLAGATVLRADADDAKQGDYGAVRALVRQLARALPEAAAHAAAPVLDVLVHVVPELAEGKHVAPAEFTDPNARRPRIQAALRQLFVAVAEQHPLFLGIDDLHRLDEPSCAAIALLARTVRSCSIAIVATADAGAPPLAASAQQLFTESANGVTLPAFDQTQVKTLLESVFGGSNVDGLVARAYVLSRGNPRDVMRLAQHLVDHGVVHYRAGAWTVPARIDHDDLPASVGDMLAARRESLSDSARQLGTAFALGSARGFRFEECVELGGLGDPAQTVRDLEQLVTNDILRAAGDRYVLSDDAFRAVLLASLPSSALEATHERLARIFEKRGDDEFRVAQHVLRAGQREQALDLFVAHATRSQERTDQSSEAFYELIRSLPEDWLQTYEDALALCREVGRPERQVYALQSRLAGLVAVVGLRDTAHIPQLIAQLEAACGLADWAAQDPTLEAMPRLVKALEATQARYDATPEPQRVLEPVHALRALARATITSVGACTPLLDVAGLRALPSLEPLAVLSPALGVVDMLVQGVLARITGRNDAVRELYVKLLERTAQPDRAGLDPAHHHSMRVLVMNGLGLMEASMGLPSSLRWADQIQADPLFQANASLIRMLYQLWQGNCHEAEKHRSEHELLRVQSSARQAFENTHLLWQVTAHAAMEDLTRLKNTVDEIVGVAGDHAGWQPVLAYARAEHQRVRGDAVGAAASFGAELGRVRAGDHQIWANLAGSHVRALDDAGRSAEAAERGLAYLEDAERAQLGFGSLYVLLPLVVARAKLEHQDALTLADTVIERLVNMGSSGLLLGLAYEARARIAIAQRDKAAYEQYTKLCQQTFAPANNPALVAKCRRLKREAQRLHLVPISAPVQSGTARGVGNTILKSKLRSANGASERGRVVLTILAEQSGATDGVLYRMTEDGPVFMASIGTLQPNALIEAMVRDYIAGELQGHDADTDAETENDFRTEWSAFGEATYRPVLLSHYANNCHAITGLAVFGLRPGQPFVHPGETAAALSLLAVEDMTTLAGRDE